MLNQPNYDQILELPEIGEIESVPLVDRIAQMHFYSPGREFYVAARGLETGEERLLYGLETKAIPRFESNRGSFMTWRGVMLLDLLNFQDSLGAEMVRNSNFKPTSIFEIGKTKMRSQGSFSISDLYQLEELDPGVEFTATDYLLGNA